MKSHQIWNIIDCLSICKWSTFFQQLPFSELPAPRPSTTSRSASMPNAPMRLPSAMPHAKPNWRNVPTSVDSKSTKHAGEAALVSSVQPLMLPSALLTRDALTLLQSFLSKCSANLSTSISEKRNDLVNESLILSNKCYSISFYHLLWLPWTENWD